MEAANNDVTGMINGEITLSCTTNNNWKRCIWEYDEKMCIFEYVFKENEIVKKWRYDEVECDAIFGNHEFVKPDVYDKGNNNKECKIKMKQLALDGKYQCNFQNCYQEENNTCKTQISRNCKTFSAIINLKVNLFNFKAISCLLSLTFKNIPSQHLNRHFVYK